MLQSAVLIDHANGRQIFRLVHWLHKKYSEFNILLVDLMALLFHKPKILTHYVVETYCFSAVYCCCYYTAYGRYPIQFILLEFVSNLGERGVL